LVEPPSPCESVSTIMSTKVVTAKANERVGKALQMMVRDKIGSIVVIEKGKPVGILTERDVSMRVAKGQNVRAMAIRNVMSTPLFTITPSAEVWQAVEQMVRKDIVRLPVVDEGRLVGMVTERDIFRWMIKIAYEPNLPNDLMELVKSRAQAHALAH
jgi:CBS domain-containing protein